MRLTWTMTSKLVNLALGLGLLGAVAAGCLVTNQNHCGLKEGACGVDQMCSVCAVDNNGCVAMETVLESGCQFAGDTSGSPSSATDTTSPTTISPTTTDSTVDPTFTTGTSDVTTTIGPTSMVTLTTTSDSSDTSTETTMSLECEGDVVGNPACGGDQPYCIDNDCVDCTRLNCSSIDMQKPTCAEDLGLCVGCLENSDCLDVAKPACDVDTATCKPCTEHNECEATACNLEEGTCMPETCVYFVDQTKGGPTPCNEEADGQSAVTALCTLQKAASLLKEGMPCTIKVKAGSQVQSAPTTIPEGNITVAIVPYANLPSLSVPNDAAITINPGNRVYMSRIPITNSMPTSNPAIECDDAVLWLDGQSIFNTVTALHAKDCRVHIRRSIIFGHKSGGLDIEGVTAGKAQLWLENSYVTSMTSAFFGAIRLIGSAEAHLRYSTVALVKSPVASIGCTNGFTGSLTIRNSAIIGAKPLYGVACKVTVETSHESFEVNQGELAATFSSFNGGQFQAKPGGPLMDKAVWKAMDLVWMSPDPKTDQDGTARPKVDGAADYAGADRPQ